jgi:hypothetical protein
MILLEPHLASGARDPRPKICVEQPGLQDL